jgi:hypothetical protein
MLGEPNNYGKEPLAFEVVEFPGMYLAVLHQVGVDA